MFRLLAGLFAADPAAPAAAFRPQLNAMEGRDAPATLALDPLTIRGFNPQPDPPVQVRGIIVEGGHTARAIFSIN
jgi:hypothetical protein